jgi:DNA-binding NarL/FixJ family response regulator
MAKRGATADSGGMESSAAARKVFIVEDAPFIRMGLVEIVDGIEGVCVVGEAESVADAVAGIFATRPQCVILDFRLIDGTGVDVMRAVHPALPEIRFVVLTNHPSAQYRRVCMDAGATAFLDKSTEFGRLREVVAGCVFPSLAMARP